MKTLQDHIDKLNSPNFKEMYENDLFLIWEGTDEEPETVRTVVDVLRFTGENNISTKVSEGSLGVPLFRDNSTRIRFFLASVCNLLGLEVQDSDEGKSQVAHGETVRETANMISSMADAIGIHDDMYTDKGNVYMHEVVNAVTQDYRNGTLEQKPTLVNLQCDIDHLTQCIADVLRIIHEFGGVEDLKGKKLATTWAYSPSYGKPLSVPQGAVGLITRMGMKVVLAHPEGHEIMPEVEEVARKNTEKTDGSLHVSHDTAGAFKDISIVYPRSWAPFAAMEKRANLYAEGDHEDTKTLEKEFLAQNAEHKDQCCTEGLMKATKGGKALYLHCLPADINDASCKDGGVEAIVFDHYHNPLYKETSYKPYVIVAMIMLAKFTDLADVLKRPREKGTPRVFK